MSTTKVTFINEIDGVNTDVDTVLGVYQIWLSDPGGTYGVRRTDTLATVVADSTAMTRISAGVYEYEFTDPAANLDYLAYVQFVYDGETYYVPKTIEGAASVAGMAISYAGLLDIVGRKMYGLRTGHTAVQLADINDAIRNGLREVYAAWRWSFLRPRYTITTTAPQTSSTVGIVNGVVTLAAGSWPSWAADGIFSIEGAYYAVASRDSGSQLTLVDTTVDADALSTYSLGKILYDLPSGFDALDGPLTYAPDCDGFYPAVDMVKETDIRIRRQRYEYSERPALAAIVASNYDPTAGSKRQLLLYPTPDDTYQLTAVMRLRPTMIDSVNLYPIGGEVLSQVIVEGCIIAGLRLLDEPISEDQKATYDRLLAQAIQQDKLESSPQRLGPDAGGEQINAEYARPIPTILFDGVEV